MLKHDNLMKMSVCVIGKNVCWSKIDNHEFDCR